MCVCVCVCNQLNPNSTHLLSDKCKPLPQSIKVGDWSSMMIAVEQQLIDHVINSLMMEVFIETL